MNQQRPVRKQPGFFARAWSNLFGLFAGAGVIGVVGGFFALIFAPIIGWFANIVQLVQLAQAAGPATTMFWLKLAGVLFPPLGMVLGWVGFFA